MNSQLEEAIINAEEDLMRIVEAGLVSNISIK